MKKDVERERTKEEKKPLERIKARQRGQPKQEAINHAKKDGHLQVHFADQNN